MNGKRGRGKKNYKASARDYVDLAYVTTASEVARIYSFSLQNVLNSIDSQKLAAKKVGAIWLVSYPSCEALWGKPCSPEYSQEVWNN